MNKKWLWIGGIVLIIIGFFIWRGTRVVPAAGVQYKKSTVKVGKLDVLILSTGTVQPENRVDIKPPIAGRVEKVLVQEGDVVKKGQILAWLSSTERAALLDAASAKGDAEVKVWEDLYKATPILAPINGMIILRSVESGQTFTVTDAILSMSDRLTVKAQVDETDIAQIKLKQSASIILDAYPGQKVPAMVDQIAYDAKTVNNVTTYVVDALPIKTPSFMRSGMTANVTFEVNSKPDALLISVDAVKIHEGKSIVMVPADDGQTALSVNEVNAEKKSENKTEFATERVIQTGLTDGKRIEVTAGLAENDNYFSPDFKFDASKKNANSNPFNPMGGKPPPKHP